MDRRTIREKKHVTLHGTWWLRRAPLGVESRAHPALTLCVGDKLLRNRVLYCYKESVFSQGKKEYMSSTLQRISDVLPPAQTYQIAAHLLGPLADPQSCIIAAYPEANAML